MPKGYEAVRQADISESEAFRKPRDGEAMRQSGVHGKRNLDMSDQHRMQLQVIKDRDAELVIVYKYAKFFCFYFYGINNVNE